MDKVGKAKSTVTGDIERADASHVPKRTVAKMRVKKPTTVIEAPRGPTGQTVAQSSKEESATEVLGPALVVGALGRKIGDARTATMMRGITECRVELLSTRQKAKLPVPAVPNNSAKSNSVTEYPGTSEARLSLFATDMNVQLELPSDVSEGIGGEEVVMASVVGPDKGRAMGRLSAWSHAVFL